MRYLFSSVVPPDVSKLHSPIESLPMGLAYVASALRRTGRYVSGIHVAWHNDPIEALLQKIRYEDIDVLCLSGMSRDFPALRETISVVRKNCPHVKIVVGGYIITAEPEFIAKHLDIDFGCIGYGEETICELADCLETNGDYSSIKGLIYMRGGGMFINPKRPQPESLDNIPFPALELFGFTGRNQCLLVLSARSCIGSCTFCYRFGGYKYITRSLDNVFLEIDYWREKFPISTILFHDELFAYDKYEALIFCSRIKEYDITYAISLRVDIVSEELIKALAESGCTEIFYGIESMNQKVLDSMRKNITVEQTEYALKITHKYNITALGNLIFGDPAETYDIAKESQEWWLKNTDYSVLLDMIIPYPGSALYNNGLKKGQIKDKLSLYENGYRIPINLSAMTDAEYNKVQWQNAFLQGMVRQAINIRYEIGADGKVIICGDCPTCGTVNYTGRIKGGFNNRFAGEQSCRGCNSKILFKTAYNNYFELRYFNDFCYEGKKIAVWGLSEKAKFRIATNKYMREVVAVIVDRNYNCFKNTFLGFEVQSPKVIGKTDFNVLYIGSSISRESIINMAWEIVGDELFKKEIMIMD